MASSKFATGKRFKGKNKIQIFFAKKRYYNYMNMRRDKIKADQQIGEVTEVY